MKPKKPHDRKQPVRGHLRHALPGRVRIVLEKPLPLAPALEELVQALCSVEGVTAAEVRPATGSLIVRHDGDFAPIERAATKATLLVLGEPEPPPPLDPISEVLARAGSADAAISRLTNGRVDLMGLTFTALIAGGLVQIARGHVAGPALALFGQAATLAMTRAMGLSSPQ